ncbi:MAG: gliding motility-associated C-terminal domain-containing protein [Saprospiraceae bacterium]|nr:gliding motility-associated C-terminal domain-containing protein [Saprospiraceae bacterium]
MKMKALYYIASPMIKRVGLSFLFAMCILLPYADATHIVGGQLTYRAVGNGYYDIRLVIRRDCEKGIEPFDPRAVIGVFYSDNQKAYDVGLDGVFQIEFNGDDTIRDIPTEICIPGSKGVCVHEAVYQRRIFLPEREKDFILVYQRCCRNETLSNIVNPLETGTTYVVRIPGSRTEWNISSPQFGAFPPIYTCVNEPFLFDHSATDPEGDSLAYFFIKPNLGKTILNPADRPDPPPYDSVVFNANYSVLDFTNAGVGNSPLKIDPLTGIITGTPIFVGQFLIGVAVHKYRNGKLVRIVTRDFQLNVVMCGQQPTADFSVESELCDGLDQRFTNKSVDAMSYDWYFDFQNNRNLRSSAKDPSFTFPAAGTYEVVLVAINGSCTDTIRKLLTVIDPGLKPDFRMELDCDPDLTIRVFDQSMSNFTIVDYRWLLVAGTDSLIGTEKNVIFNPNLDGRMTIHLTITDSNGCTARISKDTVFFRIRTDLIGDSIEICIGQSIRIVRNPDTSYQYTWTPTKWLDLTNPHNPVARPDSSITYFVSISDGICDKIDSIYIRVKDTISFKVTGDTTTCDGKISLMAMSDSTDIFLWSSFPDFRDTIGTGAMFMININGDRTIYVKAGRNEDCPSRKSIRLLDHSVKLQFGKEHTICVGDTLKIKLNSLDPTDSLKVNWIPDSLIVEGQGTGEICVLVSSAGKFVLKFSATNQHACQYEDSIIIQAVDPPVVDFELMSECGSLKVKVSTRSKGKIKWDFGDGVGMSTDPMVEYTYQKNGRYKICLTIDSVCSRTLCKEVAVFFIKPLSSPITICHGQCTYLNPNGDSTLIYMWSPGELLEDSMHYNPYVCCDLATRFTVKIQHPDFLDCPYFDTVDVMLFPRKWDSIVFPKDTFLCEPDSLMLSVIDTIDYIDSVYWCDSRGSRIGSGKKITVKIDSTDYFIIKLIDKYGCSYIDSVYVTLYDFKGMIIGPNQMCSFDTIMLQLDTILPDGHIYHWTPSDGIIGPDDGPKITVSPNSDITYTLTIDNGKGCVWELSHSIEVSQVGRQIFANADPAMIVPGYKTQLTTVEDSRYTYNWDPKDGSLTATDIFNPMAMPMVTTTYTVTVTDELGCVSTASVTVMVKSCEEAVFLPNAFSPNNDGKNDFFYPRSDFLTKVKLEIYSRWGEKVFETDKAEPGWDGTFKGDQLPPDVYGYFLRFYCFEDKEFTRKGNVNLIK